MQPGSRRMGCIALLILGLLILLLIYMALSGGVTVTYPHHHQTAGDISSYGCGTERWPIKTGTDLDVGKVNLSTTSWTSPGRLSQIPAPSTLPQNNRIAPVEDTVYRMTVTLIAFKEEADSDIHLQLVGGSGVHMIGELAAPSCTQQNSPFYSRIVTARSTFQSLYGTISGSWRYVNRPIALTGVGYFDALHGQTGVAVNGVELHPVLSVKVP